MMENICLCGSKEMALLEVTPVETIHTKEWTVWSKENPQMVIQPPSYITHQVIYFLS